MPATRNIVDLSDGFSFPDTTRSFIKKFFSIDVLGIYDNRLLDNEKDSLVLRIQNTKQGLITTKNNYFYLYYQDFQGNLDNTYGNTDILTIYDFFNSKNLLKKLAGKNIGFEFMISKLRYLNVSDLGKWFSFVKYFYFSIVIFECKMVHLQFNVINGNWETTKRCVYIFLWVLFIAKFIYLQKM